ncbi:hypothetical protein [Actinokineospora spheciospongiae]|uniref:hypothetical protein n=1 Tax=Actinokineospora spheciospongiae TaxID=909613 RepID=UPI0011B58ABB|nr:hypothetical protein [Actinokineospora spheciospongiae]
MPEADQPLSIIEHQPSPDFNQFLLFDAWSDLSYGDLPDFTPGSIATTGPGGGIFLTQGDLARPCIRLEVQRKNSSEGLTDSDTFEGQLTCETGKLLLGSISASPDDLALHLEPGAYAIKAWRSRVRREYQLDPEIFDEADNPGYFSEDWLIQLEKLGG